MSKNKVTLAKGAGLMITEVSTAMVDTATAIAMAKAITNNVLAARKSTSDAYLGFYEYYSNGAWLVSPEYKSLGDKGWQFAACDFFSRGHRPMETAEQYAERVERFRSSAYNIRRAGYLLSILKRGNWYTANGVTPADLVTIAKIVGSAAMKGDLALICETAAGLIAGVESGEIKDSAELAAAVKAITGGGDPEVEVKKSRSVVVAFKVAGDADDDKVKAVKAAGEAAMARKAKALGIELS